jgi:hypothetical protein
VASLAEYCDDWGPDGNCIRVVLYTGNQQAACIECNLDRAICQGPLGDEVRLCPNACDSDQVMVSLFPCRPFFRPIGPQGRYCLASVELCARKTTCRCGAIREVVDASPSDAETKKFYVFVSFHLAKKAFEFEYYPKTRDMEPGTQVSSLAGASIWNGQLLHPAYGPDGAPIGIEVASEMSSGMALDVRVLFTCPKGEGGRDVDFDMGSRDSRWTFQNEDFVVLCCSTGYTVWEFPCERDVGEEGVVEVER